MVRLTPAQALRMERMGEALWPTEKLSAAEVTRRLALTQLLWAESERGMVRVSANQSPKHVPRDPIGAGLSPVAFLPPGDFSS